MNRGMSVSARCIAAGLIGVWLASAATAGTVTWSFNIQSSGADAFWTSPTPTNPAADLYRVGWTITKLEVRVVVLFVPMWVDVTSTLPPEMLSGSAEEYGPSPVVAYQGQIIYPDPPDPLTIQMNLEVGLDAGGYGYVNMTDIVFGVAPSPPAPPNTPLTAIRVQGVVAVDDVDLCAGDLNCDGVVDFFDIDALVLALSGPDAYAAQYPECEWLNGDIDKNYGVDFFDIDGFVGVLGAVCD